MGLGAGLIHCYEEEKGIQVMRHTTLRLDKGRFTLETK